MAPDEYTKALEKAFSDLEERVQRRDVLNAEIAGLRETLRVLSNRVRLTSERQHQVAQLLALVDNATPNLTDAIRELLTRVYPKEMTAIEVRNAVEDSSNLDDFSNSLSACHAALKRMLSDGQVELGPTKEGKASYRRVLKLEPPPRSSLDPESPLVKALNALLPQHNLLGKAAETVAPFANPPKDLIEDALAETMKKKKK